jgi:hypothetical protein
VEEGQHDEHHVVGLEAEEDVGVQAVEERLAVGEHRALRLARGAGGVHDDVGLLRVRGAERRGEERPLPIEGVAVGETLGIRQRGRP